MILKSRRKACGLNLTDGPILRNVVMFALPLLLMNLIQQVYSVSDLLIVSHYCGTNAMAAIGATIFITQMLFGLAIGFSIGCSVIAAQARGGGDYDRLYKTVHTGYALAFAVGILLSAVGILLSWPLLVLMGTPGEVMQEASVYLRIVLLGLLPILVCNMGAGILRGVGDTRHPFIFLTISVLLNILLDYLFVGVFAWGTTGAAWAYVIAQAVSAILVTVSLVLSHEPFRLFLRDIAFHGEVLRSSLRLGIPAGLQAFVFSLSNVYIQSYINSFGKQAIAGYTAAGRIDGFVFVVINGLSLTVMSFISANAGAQKPGRARKGLMRILLMSVGVVALMSFVLMLLRRPLILAFGADGEVQYYAYHAMWLVLVPYPVFAVTEILGGAIRGAGQSLFPMIVTMGMACSRLLWTVIVLPFWSSFDAVLLNFLTSWVAALITYAIYLKRRGGIVSGHNA